MARPKKEGNQYFSFDVDFFSDKKIKILKSKYGADGICIYLYLLCEIYKRGYYLKMDEDLEFILSYDLHMSCDKVKQVLTFLLGRSLFDNKLFQSDAVLTSTGIQRRFQLMVKSRAMKNPISVDRYWLLSEEETETFIKVRRNGDNSEKNDSFSENNSFNSENKYIKENKSKRKEKRIIEDASAPFDNPELESYFQLFLDCRRNNDEVLMGKQICLLREELQNIADTDEERIEIARKAAMSGWKSFYRYSEKKQKKERTNGFNNFDGRKYDMDNLEIGIIAAQGAYNAKEK